MNSDKVASSNNCIESLIRLFRINMYLLIGQIKKNIEKLFQVIFNGNKKKKQIARVKNRNNLVILQGKHLATIPEE